MIANAKKRILIIDDELSIQKLLKHTLESHAHEVIEAVNGKEGIQKCIEQKPDLIILDFGLPDLSGIEVLQKIREWSKIPILFLTVRGSDEDKVAALDAGADDYLTKPFSATELLARIRVAFRHIDPEPAEPILRIPPIEIDRDSHRVRAGGVEVKLTATEFQLLAILARHVGKLISHRQILKEVWGPNAVEHAHYLRVHFGQIRKKLNAVLAGSGDVIENESGVGYRLRG